KRHVAVYRATADQLSALIRGKPATGQVPEWMGKSAARRQDCGRANRIVTIHRPASPSTPASPPPPPTLSRHVQMSVKRLPLPCFGMLVTNREIILPAMRAKRGIAPEAVTIRQRRRDNCVATDPVKSALRAFRGNGSRQTVSDI